MSVLLAAASVKAPSVEWNTLIPYLVLAGGAILTLFVSLISGRTAQRGLAPLTAVATLIASGVFFAIGMHSPDFNVLSGALRVDDLACVFSLIFIVSALASMS